MKTFEYTIEVAPGATISEKIRAGDFSSAERMARTRFESLRYELKLKSGARLKSVVEMA